MDFLFFLQELRNPVLDTIFNILTNLGSEIIVIGVLCLFFWCLDKKTAYKLCFTYFISGLAVQGLKIGFRIERPWVKDSRLYPVEAAREGATGYSFPSGHTQGSTGLFSALAFHFKKAWGYIVAFAIIALVMFTRMYLGCHTPADVLVAFGITVAVSFGVNYVFEHFKATKTTNVIVLVLIEIISIALIGYSYYVVASGKSTTELAIDCFKAAGAGIGFGIGWFIEVTFVRFDPKATRTIWGQILKIAVGLGVALLLKSGLKMLFGEYSIPGNIIRYALAVLWIVGIFPIFIKKFSKKA
ncbi:MAG: phosphatase PAP2 family protein [Butyrivibrio sp.]